MSSSAPSTAEWYTPPEIFEALGLTFDLDPCSPGYGKSYVPALRHFTIHDDGLTQDWAKDLVFMHPPQFPNTKAWMEKMSAHGNGIALVVTPSDAKWLREHAAKADLVCVPDPSIRFYQGSITRRGEAGTTASVLFAYGATASAALAQSSLGACSTTLAT